MFIVVKVWGCLYIIIIIIIYLDIFFKFCNWCGCGWWMKFQDVLWSHNFCLSPREKKVEDVPTWKTSHKQLQLHLTSYFLLNQHLNMLRDILYSQIYKMTKSQWFIAKFKVNQTKQHLRQNLHLTAKKLRYCALLGLWCPWMGNFCFSNVRQYFIYIWNKAEV